jgi:hypothetical protein
VDGSVPAYYGKASAPRIPPAEAGGSFTSSLEPWSEVGFERSTSFRWWDFGELSSLRKEDCRKSIFSATEPIIIGLYRFLDWVLILSEELGTQYQRQLNEYEEEKKMPYVTTAERVGIKKGSVAIILRLLQQRFGALEEAVQDHIQALPLAEIEALGDAFSGFAVRADLEAWLQQHPRPPAVPLVELN